MFIIEQGFGTEGNESDYIAYIVISENAEEAEKEYHIGNNVPEIDEIIETAQGAWSKKIYIFGNAGDGIIIYAPLERKESERESQ